MPGGVNLIPQSRIVARRRLRRTRRWCVACSAYAAVLAGAWGVLHLVAWDEQHAIDGELATLRQQTQEDRAAIERLQPRITAAAATLAASRSVGDQADWSLMLSLLAELLGDDAVLASCDLSRHRDDAAAAADRGDSARSYRLRLTGLARTQAAALAYVQLLEETELFATVKVIETRPEPFGGGSLVRFNLECVLADPRSASGHTQPTAAAGGSRVASGGATRGEER
jgi:Tfp pilus assembly protein PilN